MSTKKGVDRRRGSAATNGNGTRSRTTAQRTGSGTRSRTTAQRTGDETRNRAAVQRTGGETRSRTTAQRNGNGTRSRTTVQKNGRGMSRLERQKQLRRRMLLGVAAFVVLILVLVVSVRAALRRNADAAPQAGATAQGRESVQNAETSARDAGRDGETAQRVEADTQDGTDAQTTEAAAQNGETSQRTEVTGQDTGAQSDEAAQEAKNPAQNGEAVQETGNNEQNAGDVSDETGQTAEMAQAADEAGDGSVQADTDTENTESAGNETAVSSETTDTAAGVLQGQEASGGAGIVTGAQTETVVEEEPAGSTMADQSLVEKLSVDAKKNLETEKIRLAEEAEERERQAEEEARKAAVLDRDELSELSVEDLVEYLRNKEVPEELIEFMEEYPEAREFVTDYLYQPETPPSMDISGEVELGEYPHFLQWDERWGYKDYGGSFFAVAGCGPTALSVVYCGMTGKSDMNPYEMSVWADEKGYYIPGSGTSWEMMWNGCSELGLAAWEVDNDETSIITTLQNGFPIIAAMSPGGDFTNFGHFIVLTDVDEYGNITIRDSNSNVRTERTWTADELTWQIAGLWAYNAY